MFDGLVAFVIKILQSNDMVNKQCFIIDLNYPTVYKVVKMSSTSTSYNIKMLLTR